MNDLNPAPTHAGEAVHKDSSPSPRYRLPSVPDATAHINERLTELEIENSRLHRLVAELLIKNQQLRKPDQASPANR
jgi:hypothetical protein